MSIISTIVCVTGVGERAAALHWRRSELIVASELSEAAQVDL